MLQNNNKKIKKIVLKNANKLKFIDKIILI